jgi:hypothetical protein
MAMHVTALYCAVFTFGVSERVRVVFREATDFKYDGAYLNGLLIVPAWGNYFDHPAGQKLGLVTASFYFRKLPP